MSGQIPFTFDPPQRNVLSVGELTRQVRELLGAEFANVWVSGEISGVKLAASGHYYFTIKDDQAQIRAVLYRMTGRFMRFKPKDGVAVLARGRVDVYDQRGEYQLVVNQLEPTGHGGLQLAFEQLKKKLAAEGLFDAERKKPLPKLPQRIGIVTSPSGAVIRDILHVLERRFAGLHIRLFPAQVQGEGSVEAVCRGLRYFSRSGWAEVVIVARGGGSIEDLWTFNEEAVARAIAASAVPVISAIGHETDYTIADFVADLRAPTPSAAAEMVIGTREELRRWVLERQQTLQQRMRLRLSQVARRVESRGVERAVALLQRRLGRWGQRLDEFDQRQRQRLRFAVAARQAHWRKLDARLRHADPRLRLAALRKRWQAAAAALAPAMRRYLESAHRKFGPLDGQLTQLSPLRVLDRGYALVQDSQGRLVKDAAAVAVGEQLQVRLARGRVEAEVTKAEPGGDRNSS